MIARALLILFACNAILFRAAAQSPIVGVLEDVPGVYAGQQDTREVRVAFQKSGDEWVAFPSNCPDQTCLKTVTSKFPRKVIWNVGFNGRLLGQVSGRTPNDFDFYAHVGLQEITSKTPVPTLGAKSLEFGGYAETPVYRPLIVNSEPYFSDPDGWQPSQLAQPQIQMFRRQFRRKFPRLCKSNGDETRLEPLAYRDQEIQVIKAYASLKGWKIARLHLQGATSCNDDEAGSPMQDPWFALDHRGRFHYLGSGMWLVDVGDYDKDGSSELIFSIDRNNRGGYILFYNDFSDRAVFQFGYH